MDFHFNLANRVDKKRTTNPLNGSQRSSTVQYHLKTANGELERVCQKFYLSTLGLKSDSCVRSFCSKNKTSKKLKWGQHKKFAVCRKKVSEHIEFFNACISHYRREHAPNRRYLPSEVTLEFLYSDCQQKYPEVKCSKSSYLRIVRKELKISFAALGHEECKQCESFDIHKKETGHTVSQEVVENEEKVDCGFCDS